MENDFCFRIEFSIQCPFCDRPLPLDGPLESVFCRNCLSEVEVPREYWIDTLENACRKMQGTKKGEGRGSMLIGTFHGNLTLARFDPYCDRCKTEFADPWKLEHGTFYTCSKCGAVYPVQKPPEWLTTEAPSIITMINALISEGSQGSRADSADRITSFSCPSCAGQLSVEGISRLIKCDYCDANVYIPDNVWLRLHAGKRKRRWFVICERVEHAEE